jgi:diadenylate cyclase
VSDLSFILSRLDISGVIDIVLVTLVFYWVLTLIQGTQAVQLLRGILILSVLAVIAASALNTLTAFSWLINKALPALLVAIPVIFQPELRRALERLGRTGGILATHRTNPGIEKSIEAVSEAAIALSLARHGALIVFERDTGLEDHIETGIRLNALTTPELLTTIFFPNTILHDGGIIIRGDKIMAAATVLPLSQDVSPDKSLGTRHRAAIGITETSDAIAVIVSEESGIISVAHDGQLIRGLDKKRLNHLLRAFYKNQLDVMIPNRLRPSQNILKRLKIIRSDKSVAQSQSKR